MDYRFYVYILANLRVDRPVIYVGMTNNLERRLGEHRLTPKGFTGRYHVDSLVYVEMTCDVNAVIAREKQIKGWNRAWKIRLIEKSNPNWEDLFPRILG